MEDRYDESLSAEGFFDVRIEDARLLAPSFALLIRPQLRADPLVHPLCVNLAHLILRQFFPSGKY